MKTLTVTDDRVREAARNCGDARNVLKTLFPEAFEPEYVEFTESNMTEFIGPRVSGVFQGRCLYLMEGFDWEVTTDGEGCRVLVARRRP